MTAPSPDTAEERARELYWKLRSYTASACIEAIAAALRAAEAERDRHWENEFNDERKHHARQFLDADTAAFNARVWMSERFEKWASNPTAWTNDDDVHMGFRNIRHIAERIARAAEAGATDATIERCAPWREIARDDLARLSRAFNSVANLQVWQDQRINEWLKHALAALPSPPASEGTK